jgi:hypothetical protein
LGGKYKDVPLPQWFLEQEISVPGNQAAVKESINTPQAPYPCIDQSQPTVSNAYQSSYAEC